MKKTIKTTIIITLLFIIFFIDYYFLSNNASTNNCVLNIIFLIVNSLFSLFIITLIHEMSHQIVAIILGMGSSIFVCYPFILSKERNRWRVSINFRNIVESLGFIIPNIPIIKDKEDYKLNLIKVAISTIIGPISSILFLIFCLIIPVYSVNFSYFIKIFIVTSLILVISSLFYDDGLMFILLLINKEYAIKTLMSMNNCSSNYFHNGYLYEIANNECSEIDFNNINKSGNYQFEIQSYVIYNHIIHGRVLYSEIINKNIESLMNSKIELNSLKSEIILYIHTAIIYLTVIRRDYDSGQELYGKYFREYEEMLKNHYLTQRTRYFLGYINSYNRILDMLENSFEYKINENKINVEKQLLYMYRL